MRYDKPQEPWDAVAELHLVTVEGEDKFSKKVPVTIRHYGWPYVSRYEIDTKEEVVFSDVEKGTYMVVLKIVDKDLGTFWVDMRGGSVNCEDGDSVTVSASRPSDLGVS